MKLEASLICSEWKETNRGFLIEGAFCDSFRISEYGKELDPFKLLMVIRVSPTDKPREKIRVRIINDDGETIRESQTAVNFAPGKTQRVFLERVVKGLICTKDMNYRFDFLLEGHLIEGPSMSVHLAS